MKININDVENLEVDGVDSNDYPDFCNTFFCGGNWIENGDELTEEQLIWLGEDYPEVLSVMAFEYYI
jgi:hypothetical protein